MHLTAEILEFFYLADNENQKLFFPEWKIFVLKRFLFSFFFLPYMTLFFSFSSSRNHSSPSSTDIYTFICVTKPLKAFPICFRFCALPAFQSLKSKLLDPPGFAPRFRFSSFEASNSILKKKKNFCFSIRLSYSASIKTDSSVCISRKKQGENSDKKERNYIISDYFFPRLTPTLLLRVPVNLHEFSSPIYSLSQKHTILSFKYSLSL
jgi:hypothetical protein